ncbi:hypothetical protein [Thiocapsa sp. N5-Cardenillas]|uniref:hypothetical protein n=1 Tax=Thiocapsa sp. N5-Cardenillas TaxID=3137397 RepID=UPI0035AEB6DC
MIVFEEKDRQAWLAFLNTESGAKGIAFLRETRRPAVRLTGQPHEIHVDAGAQHGFDLAIREVENLRLMPKKTAGVAPSPSIDMTR